MQMRFRYFHITVLFEEKVIKILSVGTHRTNAKRGWIS